MTEPLTPKSSHALSKSLSPASIPVLQAQGLGKRFQEGPLDVQVWQNLELSVQAGDTLAIVGASGSGKSTLLHVLGGLEAPSEGQVWWAGQNWQQLNLAEQGRWRNQHLGFIYQFHHLLGELSALENVAMPLRIRRWSVADSHARAADMLHSVGLGQRLQHRPAELSGGERQRVAIARALVTQPACVLADEPTGNLDRTTATQVFDLMLGLAQQQATALVLVTHDEQLAQRCGQRAHLSAGQLVMA